MPTNPLIVLDFLTAIGIVVGIYLLFSVLLYPIVFLRNLRCRLVFQRWLKENRFEVVSHTERWYWFGPFSGDRNEQASISRLELRDVDGRSRKAFVRCAAHKKSFLGQHAAEVVWDDVPVDGRSPSATRLWVWLGMPFVMGAGVLGICAAWVTNPVNNLTVIPPLAHLLILSPLTIGVGIMLMEKRRGFPNLRKLVLVDRAQYLRLILLHAATCVGGFVLSAGSVLGCFLDLQRRPADDRLVNITIQVVLGGLALFGIGLWRLTVRFRRIPERPS
jgi:hypothetical protein